jgi:CheY-like chemotaxis protein
VVALYATGEGQTTPAGVDGKVATSNHTSGLPAPRLPVRVTLGGVPTEITYAGEAPQMIGSLQVNFRVPANAPVGDAVPIVLTLGNYRSPDGVTMAVRSRTPLVLVIDDDAAIRHRLGGIMAGAGYDVLTAENTGEALIQAKDHPIDLVISGLAKPIAERAQAIRTMLAEHPRLRIMATADGLGANALVAADLLGAQAILTKPLAAEAVKRRIREILRSRPTPYVAVEEAPRFPINGPNH